MDNQTPRAFIVRNKDKAVLKASSSGGAFQGLADVVLSQGGVVFGAAFVDLAIRHIAVESPEELARLLGSKYAQSDTNTTFNQTAQLLRGGRIVLYSGTPCQIAGLLSFLESVHVDKAALERLYIVDLVCHGVGSPKVLEAYVDETRQQGFDVQAMNMRSKRYGYRNTCMDLYDGNGNVKSRFTAVDDYLRAFYKDINIRPSCYECRFKGLDRPSDVTLYDSWNAEEVLGVPYDAMGYTNVLVHTPRGESLLTGATSLDAREVPLEAVFPKHGGGNICNSIKANPKRARFFTVFNERGLGAAVEDVCPVSLAERLKGLVKPLLFRLGLLDSASRLKRGAR